MIRGFLADPARIATARKRLGHLSWFMKCLKEGIARRANAEDDCTGAFWEGRYTSVPLLDQHALLSCMAYVDLNPVRAGVADRPERSRHTSARLRGRGRQRQRVAARSLKLPESRRTRVLAAATIPLAEAPAVAADPERGQWLHPMRRCVVGSCDGAAIPDPVRRDLLVLSSEEYLTLVDATGRLLVHGKRSRIPPGLPPILARLDLSVDAWLASMGDGGQMGTGSAGTPESRDAEARRRGVRWVRSHCHLFTRRTRAA
jgi:hypothetical protein